MSDILKCKKCDGAIHNNNPALLFSPVAPHCPDNAPLTLKWELCVSCFAKVNAWMDGKAKGIKRYDPEMDSSEVFQGMVESPDGDYVEYLQLRLRTREL